MIRIDDYPTHEKNGIRFRCGRVQPFGASIVGGGGINFSIFSKDAVSCELLLYHHGAPEPYAVLPFPEEFRIGNVFSMIVYGLNYEELEYGYRFDGPFEPEHGYRLDKTQILLDLVLEGKAVSAPGMRDPGGLRLGGGQTAGDSDVRSGDL